ncbi:hypothetical protein, partial [Lentimicrobium sp.]|uniref:hypothetical protein n=1 Tax=Lentimicrobium sp. TaxID=2034841 RepID=UPI002BB2C225
LFHGDGFLVNNRLTNKCSEFQTFCQVKYLTVRVRGKRRKNLNPYVNVKVRDKFQASPDQGKL